MKRPAPDRGAALLFVVGMVTLLMMVILGLLYYTGSVRRRNIQTARSLVELPCAESGLQLARSYFGARVANWDSYLSTPAVYNPLGIGSTKATPKAGPHATEMAKNKVAAFQTSHPELFADLDGDRAPDVYFYIRDDVDEVPNNPSKDSNRTVIVGAMCISETLVAHRQDGTVDSSVPYVEAMMSVGFGRTYRDQKYSSATGTGNNN